MFSLPIKKGVYDNDIEVNPPQCPVQQFDLYPLETVDPGDRNYRIAIRGGGLSVFLQIAEDAGLLMPHLRKFLRIDSPGVIEDACRFYKRDDPITKEDIVNLLRLHAYGGGMKAWVEGMSSGMFTTQGGVLIGTTTPKNIANGTKNTHGFWQRPYCIQQLCQELSKGCVFIAHANPLLMRELSADGENEFVIVSKTTTMVVQACQVHIMCNIASTIADIVEQFVEIAPNCLTIRPGCGFGGEGLKAELKDFPLVHVWGAGDAQEEKKVQEPKKSLNPWALNKK